MSYRVSLAAINVPPEAHVTVRECLEAGDIGQSRWVELFENDLARFVGSRHAIATSSGTMADAVALAAMSVKTGLRDVIVPALTFIAQPNAARYSGLTLHFVDVTEWWVMDWEKVWGYEERAIPFPADLMGRMAVADRTCVEDACEAFGSTLMGRKAGTFGALGTYSFFVSHSITTGEGGAIVTDDDDLAELCRSIRSHGRASHEDAALKFSFPHFGFNAKMSGLTAAFGLAVLKHAKEYIGRRKAAYGLMQRLLGGFDRMIGEEIVPHGYPVEFTGEAARNTALDALLESGIECRRFFSCIPTTEGSYKGFGWVGGEYPVAEHIARTHLYVPCHQNMDEDAVKFVAHMVGEQKGIVKR